MLTEETKNAGTKNVIKDTKYNAGLNQNVPSCGKIDVNTNMTLKMSQLISK